MNRTEQKEEYLQIYICIAIPGVNKFSMAAMFLGYSLTSTVCGDFDSVW